MNKLLSVKEFDTIIGNEKYKSQYPCLPKLEFDELITFVHEYEATENGVDVLDFLKVSYKRNVGEIVNVKNYVGMIQLKSGYQIEILPKINLSTDVGDQKTKKIFLKMLHAMKDFPCKEFNEAGLQIDKMNLYEIYIHMYIQEVWHLIKHGIKSSYVSEQDNLHFLKGKLLLVEQIKHNFSHNELFSVSFDEFSPNCAENKIVKTTLLKLQRLTNHEQNSKAIKQLLLFFENVTISDNYQMDFAKVNIDRTKIEYSKLMQWSLVFLQNKSFTTFSGNTTGRAILFPMEKVFENYVARQIKKVFSPANWSVSTQDTGQYLFVEPKKQFALRPDIVLKKDGRTIVMDTKWKVLFDDASKNYGISQADMYQMYAYSKKYHAPEIILLYPITNEFRHHNHISFDSDDGTVVHVFFVDLENIDASMNLLLHAMQTV